MNSRDIEARAQKILDDIGALHEDLVQAGQTAWLPSLPCLEVSAYPNTNKIEINIKIGATAESPQAYDYINPDAISALWDVKDIKSQHPDLTDEQAKEVLATAIRNHNPDVGITWEVLSAIAEDLLEELE